LVLRYNSNHCNMIRISLIRRLRRLGLFCLCCNACRIARPLRSAPLLKPRQFTNLGRRIDKTKLRTWRYPPRKHNVPLPAQLDAELKADETNLFIERGTRQVAMSTFKLFRILTAGGVIYQMFPKRFLVVCFLAYSALARFVCATDNVSHSTVCNLPKTAEGVLEAKLPGWRIVSPSDLTEHDKVLWNAKHSYVCPGIANGDYFGDRHVAYAVTLINRQPTKMLQTLVVLKPHDGSYELIELSKAQEASRVLVVFRQRPAAFEDIDAGGRTKITSDSIAYEDIAAGMLVYAWYNDKFKEIHVSD
jgi:hypothetical protein